MKKKVTVVSVGLGEETIQITGHIIDREERFESHKILVYFPLDEDFTEEDLVKAFQAKELEKRLDPNYKRHFELAEKWLGKKVEIELPDPEEE